MSAHLITFDDALIKAGAFAANSPLDDLYTTPYLLSMEGHVVIFNTTYLDKYKIQIEQELELQPAGTRVAVATPAQLRHRFGVVTEEFTGQQILVGPDNELFASATAPEPVARTYADVQYNPPAAPVIAPKPLDEALPALPDRGQAAPSALYIPPAGDRGAVGDAAYPSYAAVRDSYGGISIPLLSHANASVSVPMSDPHQPDLVRDRGLQVLDRRWNLSMTSENEAVQLGEFALQPRAVQEQVVEPVGFSAGVAVLGIAAAISALFPIVRRAWAEWAPRPVVAVSPSGELPPPYQRRNGHYRIAESLRKLKEHQEGDPNVPVDEDIDELIAKNVREAAAPLTQAEIEELIEFHKATRSRVAVMSGASAADLRGISGSGGGGVALALVAFGALLLLNK